MTDDDLRIERSGDRWRIAVDRVVATDRADLWSACTTADRLARWMAPYRGELRLGGRWEALSDGEVWGSGTVTECDAPNGFTTTWEATGEAPSTVVVRLEDAPGGTRLLLVHDGVLDPTYPPGWATYAGMLADHVADPSRADLGPAGFAERFPVARAAFATTTERIGMR
jgi:uncharacterized protein YndB with AHSA1/START domain